ncbi:conserved protein of unknown function [Rhodovastum atsumiense]|uniref:hypothetical protein n=1 Tax=Rhodovastum atsumiense TaxID=504468 RepID=UPI002023E9F9|nr:hypothetical protein [Rhodovastum atsumiense]CAH2601091.1 conserved protein of unknown function [Rhodovastum atsumiense]
MTNGEPNLSDDPGNINPTALMGWPWKLSLFMLVAAVIAAAFVVAPDLGLSNIAGLSLPRASPWVVVACVMLSALLALLAGPMAVVRLAMDFSSQPQPVVEIENLRGEDLVPALRRLLQEERRWVQESANAAHGAMSVGVQLTEVARDAERRLRSLSVQPLQAEIPADIRAGMQQILTGLRDLTTQAPRGEASEAMRSELQEILAGLRALTAQAPRGEASEAMRSELQEILAGLRALTAQAPRGEASEAMRSELQEILAGLRALTAQAPRGEASEAMRSELQEILAGLRALTAQAPRGEASEAMRSELQEILAGLRALTAQVPRGEASVEMRAELQEILAGLRALTTQAPRDEAAPETGAEIRDILGSLRETVAQADTRLASALDVAARAGQQLEESGTVLARIAADLGTAGERLQPGPAHTDEAALTEAAARLEAVGNIVAGVTAQINGAAERLQDFAGRADEATTNVLTHLDAVASAYACAVTDLTGLRDRLEAASDRSKIVIEAAAARLAGTGTRDTEAARRIEVNTQALSAIVTRLGEEILYLRTTAERHDAIVAGAMARLVEIMPPDGAPAEASQGSDGDAKDDPAPDTAPDLPTEKGAAGNG